MASPKAVRELREEVLEKVRRRCHTYLVGQVGRRSAAVGFLIAGLLALSTLGCGEVPVRRNSEEIEAYLREWTPLGSSRADVLQYLESNGLGYEVFDGRVPGGRWEFPAPRVGGDSLVDVYLGRYWWIWRTDVLARYYFDEELLLVEVLVQKQRDTL